MFNAQSNASTVLVVEILLVLTSVIRFCLTPNEWTINVVFGINIGCWGTPLVLKNFGLNLFILLSCKSWRQKFNISDVMPTRSFPTSL